MFRPERLLSRVVPFGKNIDFFARNKGMSIKKVRKLLFVFER